jgi:hypothetical protein
MSSFDDHVLDLCRYYFCNLVCGPGALLLLQLRPMVCTGIESTERWVYRA